MTEDSPKGKRVVFHLTRREDLPFLRALWNDGEVMRYVGYPQGLEINEYRIQAWLEGLKDHRSTDRQHWIIENERGEPIGEAYYKAECEYCGYQTERIAQIDLKLAKRFWGHGYATDALQTLIRYLFDELSFETIVVSPNLANEAALKLYRRLGFEPRNRFWAEETGAEHQVWALERCELLEGIEGES